MLAVDLHHADRHKAGGHVLCRDLSDFTNWRADFGREYLTQCQSTLPINVDGERSFREDCHTKLLGCHGFIERNTWVCIFPIK